jgi:TPR repeat protein
MSNRFIAIALFLISFSTLHASDPEQYARDGEVAFYHENYLDAHKALSAAVKAGHLQSHYYLAIMYLRGFGAPINYKEAVRLFTVAAQKNHTDSQVALGVLMVEGIGIPQNHKAASVLFKKAAKSGNKDAQMILGWLYKNGVGVKTNNILAYALWNYVASQGSEWARVSRDLMYYEMSEAELYHGQELSANLPKLWQSLATDTASLPKKRS